MNDKIHEEIVDGLRQSSGDPSCGIVPIEVVLDKKEKFPSSRRVKGKAKLSWVCNNCSNLNEDTLGLLKVAKMVGNCIYCDVQSLIKPEWEE